MRIWAEFWDWTKGRTTSPTKSTTSPDATATLVLKIVFHAFDIWIWFALPPAPIPQLGRIFTSPCLGDATEDAQAERDVPLCLGVDHHPAPQVGFFGLRRVCTRLSNKIFTRTHTMLAELQATQGFCRRCHFSHQEGKTLWFHTRRTFADHLLRLQAIQATQSRRRSGHTSIPHAPCAMPHTACSLFIVLQLTAARKTQPVRE